jgi:hypothetical protein
MTAERDAGNSNTEVYEVLQSLAFSGQLHPLFFHPIASVDVLSQEGCYRANKTSLIEKQIWFTLDTT